MRLIGCSLSPYHLDASRCSHRDELASASLATALASSVLPCRAAVEQKPLAGRMPRRSNAAGFLSAARPPRAASRRRVEAADSASHRRRLDHDSRIALGWTRLPRGGVVLLDQEVSSTSAGWSARRGRAWAGSAGPPRSPPRARARQGRRRRSVGSAREFLEWSTPSPSACRGVDSEDLAPALLVGHADDDLAVEAAGRRSASSIASGPVGGGDHDQVSAARSPSISVSSWATRRFSLRPGRSGAWRDRIDSSMNTIAGCERSAPRTPRAAAAHSRVGRPMISGP